MKSIQNGPLYHGHTLRSFGMNIEHWFKVWGLRKWRPPETIQTWHQAGKPRFSSRCIQGRGGTREYSISKVNMGILWQSQPRSHQIGGLIREPPSKCTNHSCLGVISEEIPPTVSRLHVSAYSTAILVVTTGKGGFSPPHDYMTYLYSIFAGSNPQPNCTASAGGVCHSLLGDINQLWISTARRYAAGNCQRPTREISTPPGMPPGIR